MQEFKKNDRVAFTGRPGYEWAYYPTTGTVVKPWPNERTLVLWDPVEGYDHTEPKPENNDELVLSNTPIPETKERKEGTTLE